MSGAGLSVIIPAYDEADHLRANLERLVATLEGCGRPFEVIVVDDGSRDGTGDVARAVSAGDDRVRVLVHDRNRGKGRALATGAEQARLPLLVFLDADLEIPPEDVLPLIECLEAGGADVAVGSKYHPDASLRWPLARRALSRVYHVVTAILFRLPLRDTQTGLKAIRREVAASIVPRLRSRRFAWDLELLLLAHRAGHRFVTAPVHVQPAARASRVGWRGAVQAGLDTLRIFWRAKALCAYGSRRRPPRRPTRVIVSGDDLGLSASVNAGLLRALEAGGLTSVSVLPLAPAAEEGVRALHERVERADAGLHLDLLHGRSLLRFGWRALLGTPSGPDVRRQVRHQLASLASLGLTATHLDAHRHAWCVPWIRRHVLAACAREGVRAVRSLRPLGPMLDGGIAAALKRIVLLAASAGSAGAPRLWGCAAPDGLVEATEAARWVRRGRLPRYVQGRTIEIVAHPVIGEADLPEHEIGSLDRLGETRAVLEPPLAEALGRLGAEVLDFRSLADRRA